MGSSFNSSETFFESLRVTALVSAEALEAYRYLKLNFGVSFNSDS
jgi:hypothetical protein